MKRIFVGNLHACATESQVHLLFQEYGPVEHVRVMTDRSTGEPRGFAFVEMSNIAEADSAIAGLQGYSISGQPINVTEARPRPERPAPITENHG